MTSGRRIGVVGDGAVVGSVGRHGLMDFVAQWRAMTKQASARATSTRWDVAGNHFFPRKRGTGRDGGLKWLNKLSVCTTLF